MKKVRGRYKIRIAEGGKAHEISNGIRVYDAIKRHSELEIYPDDGFLEGIAKELDLSPITVRGIICRMEKVGAIEYHKNITAPIGTAEYTRERHLMRSYGLSLAGYNNMLAEQNGVCAICKKPEEEVGKLFVDHCHNSGDVRGLLCKNCNSGIGMFKDSTTLLSNAIEYLNNTGCL